MKVRSDFVSNSSSSSFVLKLKRPIETYTVDEFIQQFRTYQAFKAMFNEVKKVRTQFVKKDGKYVYEIPLTGGCHNEMIDDILKSELGLNNDNEPVYDKKELDKYYGRSCVEQFEYL